MDGLEDFIENGIEFIKNHIPSNDGSNDVGDRLADDCSENTMDFVDNLFSANYSSINPSDFSSFSDAFGNAMELDDANFGDGYTNCDFANSSEDNNSEPSFTGNDDKYSDDEYNRKMADAALKEEEYLRKKGDVKGAESAHNLAMKHIGRIKN